jgi:hypothetical protein
MIDQALGIFVSLVLIGIGLAFGVLAAGITVKLVEAYQASLRSRTWMTTRGQITHSETVWVGIRARSPRPEIHYTYEVGGMKYEGQRIVFEYRNLYSREAVDQILKEYPVGATMPLYYDPNKPQDSTLRQTYVGLASGLIIGATLLLPMILCLAAGAIGFVETLGAR